MQHEVPALHERQTNFRCHTNFQHVLKTPLESISGTELVTRAQEAICSLLATIPGAAIKIASQSKREGWDFEVVLELPTGTHRLLCEAKSRAWPNELRAIAHRIHHGVRQYLPKSSIPVLIAPYLSPQAIDFCRELDLSWADLAGNCELRIGGAYIKVLGNRNPFKRGRGTASLYSPQSSRVVHTLLLNPRRKWTLEEIAREAGVSLGQVSSVKKLLAANNWIRSTYGETSLAEPGSLLGDWAVHYKPRRRVIRLFTLSAPPKLEARIATTLSDYAFSELSAAERYAPYTRHQRVTFYVPKWRDLECSTLDLKPGGEGSNVTVYESG